MNRVIVFFVLIYNFLFKKLKFSWMKFLLTTIVILCLTNYYINCQRIFHNSNIITVSRLLGTDSIVNLNIDLLVKSDLFNSVVDVDSDKYGTTSSVIEIKAIADSSANIFSNKSLNNLPDSVKNFYLFEKGLIERKFGKKNISSLLDKIDVLYQFSIVTKKPPCAGKI